MAWLVTSMNTLSSELDSATSVGAETSAPNIAHTDSGRIALP
jgi:hypothetical protein